MEKTILGVLIVVALIVGIFGVHAVTSGVGTEKSVAQKSSLHIDDSKEISDSQESAQLVSLAKITKAQAEAIALKNVQGTVKESQLENDNGDVVYAVDVINGNTETEVIVDAGNGNVLKTQKDDNSDAQDGKDSENDGAD